MGGERRGRGGEGRGGEGAGRDRGGEGRGRRVAVSPAMHTGIHTKHSTQSQRG